MTVHHLAHLAKMHALSLINHTKSQKKKLRLTSTLNFIQTHIDRNSTASSVTNTN
jgi:hypothetical protein